MMICHRGEAAAAADDGDDDAVDMMVCRRA
jgi:hypothetical protein